MKYDNLIKHIKQRLDVLEQEQNALEKKRNQLLGKLKSENEEEITAKIEATKLTIWECQGSQKAYYEMLEYVTNLPIFEVVDLEKNDSHKSDTLCPKCSGEMTASTAIEPAPQPGYITISSHYECQVCGYHNHEHVYLPKELALQEYNLDELMKGV